MQRESEWRKKKDLDSVMQRKNKGTTDKILQNKTTIHTCPHKRFGNAEGRVIPISDT